MRLKRSAATVFTLLLSSIMMINSMPAFAAPAYPKEITTQTGATGMTGYYSFDFPQTYLAEILYPVGKAGPGGKYRFARTIARGHFLIPKDAVIQIFLKDDALANMQYIEKFKICKTLLLDCSDLDMTDKHLAYLKGFRGLGVLNVSGTYVTDAGLDTIAALGTITQLRLSHTNVHGENFKALTTMKYLDILTCSNTTLKKGSVAALKPIFPQLLNLDLGRTNLSRQDAQSITALKIANRLDLSANSEIDNAFIKTILHLKDLRILHVEDTAVNYKSLEDLRKLPKLESVFVREKQFWLSGSPRPSGGKFKIIDISTDSSAPVETLEPLH